MTKNQIEYQKLKELQRSNRANESLTRWRDFGTYSLRSGELKETSRHNSSVEDETKRHNMVVEEQSLVDLGIRQQSADAQTKQAEVAAQNAQANWYNAETNRINAGTQQFAAQTGRINAATQQGMLQETVRTNVANEALRDAANKNASVQAGAARMQAQTGRQQLDINQQMADTADFRAQTERDVAASEIPLNEARTQQTETQTGYLGQQNTRDWVDTVTGGFRNVTSGVKNIAGTVSDNLSSISKLIPLIGG